jgi:hypothetical protein
LGAAATGKAKARTLARELIGRTPDALVPSTNQVTRIVQQETRTIPIVFAFVGDPVGSGFVASLARPGRQTAVINSIRAHLAEFGIVAPVGRKGVTELLHVVADPSDKRVPEVARACLAALGNQLLSLKEQIVEFDRMIMVLAPLQRNEQASVVEGEEAHESAVSIEPSRPSFEVVRVFC